MKSPIIVLSVAQLDAVASQHLSYLVTEFGKAHTANGFGNKFKD
ncbi:hypothetical protein [Bradyrhizobium sp. 170]|nr:hypothetical protein [Bradyrhizobium sp. 170]